MKHDLYSVNSPIAHRNCQVEVLVRLAEGRKIADKLVSANRRLAQSSVLFLRPLKKRKNLFKYERFFMS